MKQRLVLLALAAGCIVLALAVFAAMRWTPMKKLHPIVFIAIAAVVGAVFQF